jgi:hypothetical protein
MNFTEFFISYCKKKFSSSMYLSSVSVRSGTDARDDGVGGDESKDEQQERLLNELSAVRDEVDRLRRQNDLLTKLVHTDNRATRKELLAIGANR